MQTNIARSCRSVGRFLLLLTPRSMLSCLLVVMFKCFHALRARLRLVGGFARSPLANSPEALLTNTINARLEDFVIREKTFCNSNYVSSHVDTRSVVSCRSVASLILTHSSLISTCLQSYCHCPNSSKASINSRVITAIY